MAKYPTPQRGIYWAKSIDHRQQSDFCALVLQLLGHLKDKQTSQGVAQQVVGSLGLNSKDLLDVMGGHLGHAGKWLFFSIKPARLKTINRLVFLQMAHQGSIDEDMWTTCVHAV